jgi:CBS domain-containing protein
VTEESIMARTVRDVMTYDPCAVTVDDTLRTVAELMRDNGIGDVIVMSGQTVAGIVTDRDIVIRAVAEGLDPSVETVDTIYSGDVATITPETSLDATVELMRDRSVRRLPVVDEGVAVGIVSIGDLAIDRDEQSALAQISAAPPNA